MEEHSRKLGESTTANNNMIMEAVEEERDSESYRVHQPLLKRSRTLSSNPLAMVGAKVSKIESLDYEINENDLFKHDWRSRSKVQVLQYIFLKWTLAFLVGLLTGLIATLINLAVENIAGYKLLYIVKLIENERYLTGLAYFTGANLILTMFAAVLCVFFAPTAAGPGIPEIKAYLNGVDTPNMYGASPLIVKIFGSIGAVSAGLDLGKEGPLVHIGACIASLLGQGEEGPNDNHRIKWEWLRYFNNDRDRRDIITCGASSGVCAAFRAPVGGVLFSLEEVATWWRSALLWRTFFSTATVAVVLRASIEICSTGKCGLFGSGGLIMFDVSDVTVTYYLTDIIPVVVIGIIGGVLGSLYNYLLHKVLRLYNLINQKGRMHKLLLSMVVSMFTSVCLFCLPFLAKCQACPSKSDSCPTNSKSGNFKQFNCPDGYYNDLATLLLTTNDDAVRNIFSTKTPNEYQPTSLLIFFALYCILGLLTFGIAVPSGLFLPIILIGSGYGRLLGIAMGSYTNIDEGLHALLGAASLMAGSMRMTVSLCVIFLELTNNLHILPITMIVLLIAKTVGDSINPSIYEIILHLKGLPFLDANPEPWMRNLTVGELADAKEPVVTLCGVEKVSRIVEVLKNTTHNGFPVVDEEVVVPIVGSATVATELHGLILRAHLVQALKKKWFLLEKRRTEEWEAREKFTWVELAERKLKIEEVAITRDEMEMYVDLHPLTNTTPHTVVENMSVGKAMVLFRQVGLRHLLVVPKYQGAGVPPVIGILTRKDLRAYNILIAFPHLVSSKTR